MSAPQTPEDARRILAAASQDSADWDDETWGAWWRTAERAHGDGPKTTPTPDREQEIRARAEAATRGPWGVSRDLDGVYTIKHGTRVTLEAGFGSDGDVAVLVGDDVTAYRNSEFIARAREDVDWLLARIAELEKENAGLNDLRLRAVSKNDQLRDLKDKYSAIADAQTRENARLRADRDAAVAAAVRRALEDAANAASLNVHASAAESVRRWLLRLAEYAAVASPDREQGEEKSPARAADEQSRLSQGQTDDGHNPLDGRQHATTCSQCAPAMQVAPYPPSSSWHVQVRLVDTWAIARTGAGSLAQAREREASVVEQTGRQTRILREDTAYAIESPAREQGEEAAR